MSQSGFFTKADSYSVPEHDHDVRSFDPGEAPGRTRIEKFRAIVRAHSVMCVEGQPVDAISAQVVVAVYDALSKPDNRHALMSPPSILRVVDMAMRCVSRSKTRAA